MTKIMECTCKHDYQDATYGKNKRVFNKMQSDTYRCTVCSATKGTSGVPVTKAKK